VPPHAFAVDARRLAFAAFRRERGGLAVREYQSVPLPPGVFGPGPLGAPLGDPDGLARALDALLSRLAAKPRHASLVLPDAWARALVVELGELPERPDLRLEILRFRLRKLVPFRVDELRLAAAPIVPVADQEDPVRALVLFAADSVCAALEGACRARGVRIGQVTNATLARLEALAAAGRLGGLVALASVEGGGFTVVFAREGEPVLWRQKGFTEELGETERAAILAAELRLTRTFLAERLGGVEPAAVYLDAAPAVVPYWTSILAEGLERPVVTLAADHLPLAGELPESDPGELAALAGSAVRQVA
jgi:type IV pilus assembly protein PilM